MKIALHHSTASLDDTLAFQPIRVAAADSSFPTRPPRGATDSQSSQSNRSDLSDPRVLSGRYFTQMGLGALILGLPICAPIVSCFAPFGSAPWFAANAAAVVLAVAARIWVDLRSAHAESSENSIEMPRQEP